MKGGANTLLTFLGGFSEPMHSEGRPVCDKYLVKFGGDVDDGCFEILGSKIIKTWGHGICLSG